MPLDARLRGHDKGYSLTDPITISSNQHLPCFLSKMKIVIATCGTRGDVQPLIALALALNQRGHKTLIAAPPEHEAWL